MKTKTSSFPVESQPGAAGGAARMGSLSKADRSKLASSAAKARWAAKKKPSFPAPAPPGRHRKALTAMRAPLPRVFTDALAAAEKAYAQSLEELNYHENMTALLRARIPSLVQTIRALKNTQTPITFDSSSPDLGPLPTVDGLPAEPVPTAHPRVSRAQGAAMGVNLAEPDDEDRFLKDSIVAGGEWH